MSADKNPSVQKFLSLLPEAIREHLTPVTAEQIKQPFLLHMSKDTDIKSFTPTVTRRSLDMENRSIPRICTAPSLTGCILGYSSDLFDFMERPEGRNTDNTRPVKYRGGWAVYGLPYDIALRPSATLLPDVGKTNEHWLVTFDEDTVTYKPQLLAKFFYEKVTHKAGASTPLTAIDMFIEVLTDAPLNFDDQFKLTRGYWKVSVEGLHSAKRWDRVPRVKAEKLTVTQYTTSKRLVASLLSYEEMSPASAVW